MHPLLSKLLESRGIKDVNELNPEPIIPGLLSEQQEMDRWQKVLSEGKITVDKIAEFCRNQIKIIEGQWKNLDNSTSKNERYILLHTVYSTLLDLIVSPSREKENLERYLTSLVDK